MPEYILRGNNQTIGTNYAGIISLLNYYNYAKNFRDCWITLNLDGINFIEANQCAFLYGIIFNLHHTRGVRTYIDFKSLNKDLNILHRNGFTTYIADKQHTFKPYDGRDTTIPLKTFSQINVDAFCDYIERDFLHQRGLGDIKFEDKGRISSSYFELFDNVGLHANTSDPIFVCGQYFPMQRELKFTLVDLGDGFLKKIAEFTKHKERITEASKAVIWAIRGNSTKPDARGGTGLNDIFKFCFKTGGSLHIYTDNCYYEFRDKKENIFKVPHPFRGTTIHLIFHYLL